MKRFKFRLQKALEQRERREDARRKRFARFKADLEVENRILRTMRQDFESAYDQRSGSDLETSLLLLRFISRTRVNIARQEARIARMVLICDRLRLRLVAAGRETLKLERLRERRKAEFNAEEARRESKEADETAQRIYLMRRREYA